VRIGAAAEEFLDAVIDVAERLAAALLLLAAVFHQQRFDLVDHQRDRLVEPAPGREIGFDEVFARRRDDEHIVLDAKRQQVRAAGARRVERGGHIGIDPLPRQVDLRRKQGVLLGPRRLHRFGRDAAAALGEQAERLARFFLFFEDALNLALRQVAARHQNLPDAGNVVSASLH